MDLKLPQLPPADDNNPNHLTTAETAEYLGVTQTRVRYLTYCGRLMPVGRRRVPGSSKPVNTYDKADVESLRDTHTRNTAAS